MWVKRAGVVTPFRLLAFSLLGFVMMLAIGCAGRSGTAQPQELSDARPVADQVPAPAPPVLQDTVPGELLDPFAGANEPDPRVDPFAMTNEPDPREVADQTPAPAPSSPPEAQSDEPLDPFARAEEGAGEEYDPWESMNTNIFEFNRQVDRFVLKPVAKGYNFVVPDLVQVGISNIFSNLRFAPRFLNNVFQGKLKGAGIEMGRFLINSTVGLAGFFDVAKHVDLVTSDEDMGQTLGFYGVKPGPYLVLPLLPPFTVRDFVGFVGDVFLNPINWLVVPIIEVNNVPSVIAHQNRMTSSLIQTGSRVGETVNERSRNLEKYQGVEEATLDLYTAVRNAYLQTRAKAIRE
jgi:phospholipid-binding lipoprotein MlaA